MLFCTNHMILLLQGGKGKFIGSFAETLPCQAFPGDGTFHAGKFCRLEITAILPEHIDSTTK